MVSPCLHRRAASTPMCSERKEGDETKAQTGFRQKQNKKETETKQQTKNKPKTKKTENFKTVKIQFNHQQQKVQLHYMTVTD